MKLIKHKNSARAKPGYCYDAISNESLFLGNSTVIRIIINAIKFSLNQNDLIALAEICFNYQLIHHGEIINRDYEDLGFILNREILPGEFLDDLGTFIQLPVYEMVERIIQLLHLGKSGNKEYLQAFQDIILEYFSNENNGHSIIATDSGVSLNKIENMFICIKIL